MRLMVQRLYHILRGIFRGALNHKAFDMTFNWFYPQHFGLIQKCLSAYINDDDMVYLIFKFINEILDNTTNRLRFDTWNVNGLIIFKEASSFMLEYLRIFDCFKSKKVVSDRYREIYKPLKVIMSMLGKCINGGYINFAVCDFYKDNSFVDLS